MKSYKSSLLILISAATLTCCRTSHETRHLFRNVESRMESAPDSALLLLEQFDTNELTTRKARAQYALLYSRALDRNYIDLASDSVIAPAVKYFANHGSAADKAYTNYYLGRIHTNAGYTGEAAKLMLAAEKYASRARMSKLLSMIYNCRANLYYSQYSFDEAIDMYNKSDSCCRADGRTFNSAQMITAKAKVYYLQNKFDEAELNYKESIRLYDRIGDHWRMASAVSGLASMILDGDRISTDSLKKFLAHSYNQYSQGQVPAMDYYLWIRIYLKETKIDSARHYSNLSFPKAQASPDRLSGALSLLSQIEEKSGNYKYAIKYRKEYNRISDSIAAVEKKQLIQQIEKHYQNQELKYENELLSIHNRLILSIGAIIFLIIGFSFYLLLRHRRQIIRSKNEQIIRNKELLGQLNCDYSSLQNDYDRLTDNLKDQSEEEVKLLRALENRLTIMQRLLDLAYTAQCNPQAFYKAFKEQSALMNSGELAFSDLHYLINKRCHGLIDYLRRSYPTLTNSEIDMLGMIAFGFSFDCIRLIYNHDNVDSLYSRRTKIREKMNLPPRYRLEKYLEEVNLQLKNGEEPDQSMRT